MRPCATANALACGLILAGLVFAACTGGSPPAQPSAGSGADPGPAGTSSPEPAATEAPAATAATASAPRKLPTTAQDCRDLVSEITNEPPDAGVVMNNANTAADAGKSDRMAPMIEIVRAKKDAFRCCFDLWAKNNRGQNGTIMVVWDLKPDGTLAGVKVDPAKSNVTAPEVEACIGDVARAMTYPPSPSGKQTEYLHLFEFKARSQP